MRSLTTNRDQRSLMGFYVLLSLGAQGLLLLVCLLLFGSYVGLARKDPATLVQLADGHSIATEAMDSRDRTPAVIQKFTQDLLTLLLSATGKINSADPKLAPINDPGASVNGSTKVTTLANTASYALATDFRAAFLQELGRRTPQDLFTANGSTQRALVIHDVSSPIKINPGTWKVVVVASLLTVSAGNQIGAAETWNKEVFLRAVPIPTPRSQASDLEKDVAQTRQSGLELYAIRDFVRPNL